MGKGMLLLLGLLLTSGQSQAGNAIVPPELADWSSWVLRDQPDAACPLDASNQRQCAWAGRLELDVSDDRVRFRQQWSAYGPALLTLPHADQGYLEAVHINAQPALLASTAPGRPALRVDAGDYLVEGILRLPPQADTIQTGNQTGIVTLRVNGQPVAQPRLADGRLSLHLVDEHAQQSGVEQDSLSIQIWRQLQQSIPASLTTLVDLEVTGKARTIELGQVLPASMRVLSVTAGSGVPVSLSRSGELRVQADAGHHQIVIESQRSTAETRYAPPANTALPATEIWSFRRDVNLPRVQVEGGTIYDASRIRNYPKPWLDAPTYLLQRGDSLQLLPVPEARNQQEVTALSSVREYWMDFNGLGYFYRDHIAGRRGDLKRINATNEHELYHARLADSSDQVITLDPDSGLKGIELRTTDVDLITEGRVDSRSLRTHAWLTPMTSIDITLNYPPGVRVFHATGADSASGSWLGQWRLLDFFLVILISVAFYKLFGGLAGMLALAGMVLTIHEPGAPRFIWLAALLLTALGRVMPAGRLLTSVNRLRWVVLVLILVILVPFAIQQVRTGLHPQLLHGELGGYSAYQSKLARSAARVDDPVRTMEQAVDMATAPSIDQLDVLREKRLQAPAVAWEQQDIFTPDFKAQTGIGIPGWSWKTLRLHFSHEQDMPIRIIALGKFGNLLFQWLQVALLLGMMYFLIARVLRAPAAPVNRVTPSALLVLCLAGLPLLSSPAMAQTYPSQALLEDLKTTLLKPAACHPHCSFFNELAVRIDEGGLVLVAEYHVQEEAAVVLPGGRNWLPDSVTLQGRPVLVNRQRLDKAQDLLIALLPAGRHRISLTGGLPAAEQFELFVPESPDKVSVRADSRWQLTGVANNKLTGQTISFRDRRQAGEAGEGLPSLAPLPESHLDSVYVVRRTLTLGEDWRVQTEVLRLGPQARATELDLPLLAGEKPYERPGSAMTRHDDLVRLRFDDGQSMIRFESMLDPVSRIRLQSPSHDAAYVEKWTLNVSPLWHVDFDGPAQSGSFDRRGMQALYWQPQPGESLTVHTHALKGAPDPNRSASRVRQAEWHLALNDMESRFTLTMQTEAAFSNPVTLQLPPRSRLSDIKLNNTPLPPVTGEGNRVELDVPAGHNQFELSGILHEPVTRSWTLPVVDFGMPVTNYTTRVVPSQQTDKRWYLLLGSHAVGPAVLFWGELLVLFLIALALGHSRYTPLRAWQWALLSVGFLQLHFVSLLAFAGLFAAFRYRSDHVDQLATSRWRHNLVQSALAALFFIVMLLLLGVITRALIGDPDMQIRGNGSSGAMMVWYQDAIFDGHPIMPITLYSVPLWVHKALMLGWSLWVSFALLGWSKVLWQQWSKRQYWIASPAAPRS